MPSVCKGNTSQDGLHAMEHRKRQTRPTYELAPAPETFSGYREGEGPCHRTPPPPGIPHGIEPISGAALEQEVAVTARKEGA